MDPAFPSAPESPTDTDRSLICRLALPPIARDYKYKLPKNVAMQSHRTSFPDCTPPYEPDLAPARMLLAIPYTIVLRGHDDHGVEVLPPRSNLLLVPAETVFAQAQRFGGAAEEEARVWGPAGATMLDLEGCLLIMSVCGSRAMLLLKKITKVTEYCNEEDAEDDEEES